MSTLGKRIRELRVESNLTMQELADKIEVPSKENTDKFKSLTYGTISNIEHDKHSPNSEILLAIANFFKVTTDWLLKGDDQHNIDFFPKKMLDQLTEEDRKLLVDFIKFLIYRKTQ